MNPSTLNCAALIAAGLLCGSVHAAVPRAPSLAVKTADLNLTTEAGVSKLYRRIRNAAEAVCKQPYGAVRLVIESDLRACEADTTDYAVAQSNLAALRALHYAKTGRRVGTDEYAAR